MASRKPLDEAAVVAMLKQGMTPVEVAKAVGFSESHIRRVELRHRPDSPAIRQRKADFIAARTVRARENLPLLHGIAIPAWVERADLAADYRDTARDFGEHAAARHCRQLLAEMRRLAA